MNLNHLVRTNIKNLKPYSSARDEYQGKHGVFLDANENPFGEYNRYPDPYQKKLKNKISQIKKVSENNIFLGNGSDEVIDLVFRIFCNPLKEKALTFYPTYGIYQINANINEVEIIKIPLNEEFNIDLELIRPYYNNLMFKVIFICSPNNPTANLLNVESIKEILNEFKGIVVIDEAYIDFSNSESFICKLKEFPNLIVIQTFSKAFGLANIRVGMAFANEEIISYLNKVKPPYNISGINQKIVLERLNHYDDVCNEIKKILIERTRLIEELQKIKPVQRIYPSDSNFILVEMKNADHTYDFLIKNKVIIRNRSKIIKECLRITVGNSDENDRFIQVINTLK